MQVVSSAWVVSEEGFLGVSSQELEQIYLLNSQQFST
jgi:hypothetical protein